MRIIDFLKGFSDLYGIQRSDQDAQADRLRRAMRKIRALTKENEKYLDEIERLRKELSDLNSKKNDVSRKPSVK